ncbi:MAG: hypothetical protein ABJI60_12610, partial [Kangiellaceae bacterium]
MFEFQKLIKLTSGVLLTLLVNLSLFTPGALASQTKLEIIQRPIIFNQERETLSLEYLQQRYDIKQTKAT